MTTNDKKFDVAIVGAGILGLAHARAALEAKQSVILLERGRHATGASIRNFGMVWPVGQPAGKLFDLAMRSREIWLQMQSEAKVWVNPCGSLHLARKADELAVLEEFLQMNAELKLELLGPAETAQKSSAVKEAGLLGALWSPYELCVNPRCAILQVADWLASQGVAIEFGSTVSHIDSDNWLNTANGSRIQAERIVVCSGVDFETLFPEEYGHAGLQKCKLQMLSTVAQATDWKLGPHIAGGLTLRHYHSFRDCPSLDAVRERVATEQPELDQFGIHVMAAMNDQREVILGDSHEYGEAIQPFDSAEIEELILSEIRQLIRIPDFRIKNRWHGIYAKHPTEPIVELNPHDNCKIVTAPGGAGMTLSFGIAEQTFEQWG